MSPRVTIMCRKYGLLGIGDMKDQLGDVVRVALDLDLDFGFWICQNPETKWWFVQLKNG